MPSLRCSADLTHAACMVPLPQAQLVALSPHAPYALHHVIAGAAPIQPTDIGCSRAAACCSEWLRVGGPIEGGQPSNQLECLLGRSGVLGWPRNLQQAGSLAETWCIILPLDVYLAVLVAVDDLIAAVHVPEG